MANTLASELGRPGRAHRQRIKGEGAFAGIVADDKSKVAIACHGEVVEGAVDRNRLHMLADGLEAALLQIVEGDSPCHT